MIHDEMLNPHQRSVIDLHLDRERGSRYWIERACTLGVQSGDLATPDDLAVFGRFDVEALRIRPLEDFVPAEIKTRGVELSAFCTGGATAAPCWVTFTDSEFDAAFVAPFRAALGWFDFPRGGRWLYVGPTGAHPIGRAAELSARHASGQGAFTIDFDPRWARSLTPGSFARQRYLAHVVAQAREIICAQKITVIFSTPVVLAALAREMPRAARERIEGVHHGGMAAAPGELERLAREDFPRAAFMGGYGNSLAGMSPQVATRLAASPASANAIDAPVYATGGDRVRFLVVGEDAAEMLARGAAPPPVEIGERGRVMLSRFDPSFLILNHIERDDATRLPASAAAVACGLIGMSLGDPRHHEEVARIGGEGLY